MSEVVIVMLGVLLIVSGYIASSLFAQSKTIDRINSRLADINSKIGSTPDVRIVESLRDSIGQQQDQNDRLLDALMSSVEEYRQHRINQMVVPEPPKQRRRGLTYDDGTLTPTPVSRVTMPEDVDTVG